MTTNNSSTAAICDKFINLTPHAIVLHGSEGETYTYPPSGEVARVSEVWTEEGPFVWTAVPGVVTGLPPQEEGVWLIVSAMVADVVWRQGRTDVLAPATGAPGVKRNEAGHIVSVPGFRYPSL